MPQVAFAEAEGGTRAARSWSRDGAQQLLQ